MRSIRRAFRPRWTAALARDCAAREQPPRSTRGLRHIDLCSSIVCSAALQEPDPARRAQLFDEVWRTACAETDRHPANPDAWNNRGVAAMWLTQLAGQDHMNDPHGTRRHTGGGAGPRFRRCLGE